MTSLREFLDNLTNDQLVDRLNLALDGASLGIWDWDLRDNTVQFDRRWCEMLGLDHETTPMRLETWSSRAHPEDIAKCYADISAHLEGRTTRYENIHRMRHENGSWIYILDRGRVSARDEAGKPIRFTGTHFDVTATEEARRVIQQQKRLLRQLIEALPTAMVMLDQELRVLSASSAWTTTYGNGGLPPLGKSIEEAAPYIARHWGGALRRALTGEPLTAEEEVTDMPGGPQWLRWDARPWRTLNGDLGGVLLSLENITERVTRRQAEDREREARIASLAFFAGGISHEINSPLQIILSEVELIEEELKVPVAANAEVRDSVKVIAQTTRRAAAIAKALRNLSRDARQDPLSTVRVSDLFRDADALCRKRLESSGVSLTLVPPEPELFVAGRTAELLHILLNILNNGGDAALLGDPWVRLETRFDDTRVRFQCIDGGPGIPPENRKRLMDPFFTTKGPGRGTGLGLSIANGLAQRNRGSLELVDDRNTTFELRLERVRGTGTE